MAMTLYWGSGSPFAWRVMLTLEAKGLDYEARLLSFDKKETRTPEFLALNPRGQIPVLVDDGFVIYESRAICYYLERKHPEPPLYGRSPPEAGRIAQAVEEMAAYLDPAVLNVVRPIFTGKAAQDPDAVRAACHAVAAELAHAESALSGNAWLVGGALSIADIYLLPHVQILRRALGKPVATELDLPLAGFEARYPGILRWSRRIEALPGYERTYPPHWR
jgi:glutathione S-transferase